jgi:hypothetical protein
MKGDSHFSVRLLARLRQAPDIAARWCETHSVPAQLVKVAHLIPRANIPQRGNEDGQSWQLTAKTLRSMGETTGGESRRAKNLKAVLLE